MKNKFEPFNEDHVRAAFGQPVVEVLRATQSPMNAQRWVLDLSCGHEVWITARSRPKRKTIRCEKCVGAR